MYSGWRQGRLVVCVVKVCACVVCGRMDFGYEITLLRAFNLLYVHTYANYFMSIYGREE